MKFDKTDQERGSCIGQNEPKHKSTSIERERETE